MVATGLPGVPRVDVTALEDALRNTVDAEVRFDAGSRGAYSTDGSNYRQVPIGVVVPRSVEAGAQAVRVCREHDAPVLSRGGGTSLGGQCANVAIVIDWTKYCNGVVSVDPSGYSCVVEPGMVGVGGDAFALYMPKGASRPLALNGSGRSPAAAELGWYLGFALFKLAVILEGIYYRFRSGQTVGEGFDRIGAGVGPLVELGNAAVKEK